MSKPSTVQRVQERMEIAIRELEVELLKAGASVERVGGVSRAIAASFAPTKQVSTSELAAERLERLVKTLRQGASFAAMAAPTTPSAASVTPGGETFGTRLRMAMARAHVQNADLATAAGVHAKTVSYWLNDHFIPSGSRLGAIAALLGVDAAWLVGGTDEAELQVGEATVIGSKRRLRQLMRQFRSVPFGPAERATPLVFPDGTTRRVKAMTRGAYDALARARGPHDFVATVELSLRECLPDTPATEWMPLSLEEMLAVLTIAAAGPEQDLVRAMFTEHPSASRKVLHLAHVRSAALDADRAR